MNSRVLLLVDAMAVAYRAFYAIRELSTAAGEPTNAVFGFIRMFRQLIDQHHPSHSAVVFDGGLPLERTKLLVDYKAQRAAMPDDLKLQLPLIDEYLDRARVTRIRHDMQEADDVMASLASWAEAQPDCERVLLASNDKDLFQLVNEKVLMLSVAGKDQPLTVRDIEAKTGVKPERIVEWLALVGDSVDNIPGVSGIGPKTAARILQNCDSLDQLWNRPELISGDRLKTLLLENRELIERNVQMVRLRRDLAVEHDWDELKLQKPDARELLPFFEKLEFHRMAKDLREPELF